MVSVPPASVTKPCAQMAPAPRSRPSFHQFLAPLNTDRAGLRLNRAEMGRHWQPDLDLGPGEALVAPLADARLEIEEALTEVVDGLDRRGRSLPRLRPRTGRVPRPRHPSTCRRTPRTAASTVSTPWPPPAPTARTVQSPRGCTCPGAPQPTRDWVRARRGDGGADHRAECSHAPDDMSYDGKEWKDRHRRTIDLASA